MKFGSYSMWTDKKYERDYYEWCVFVDEGADVLNQISAVEYTLHPTFPDPVRLIEDKSTKFALFSSGWGGFSIKIRVNYHNGSSELTSYFLRLDPDSWPKKQGPKKFVDDDTNTVYQILLHDKYRWRKIDTLVRRSSLPADKVLSILGELQKEDFVRKASYLSIDGKELWGATAIVGVSPK